MTKATGWMTPGLNPWPISLSEILTVAHAAPMDHPGFQPVL